ncbi:MAG: hypothetical protein V3U78_04620 [Thiotrichaceae bacterium]
MCTGIELGFALSALGSIGGANTQAEIKERNAELIQSSATFEEQKLRKQSAILRGRQQVAASKSGVAQSGSILEVMKQSAIDAELEALNIQFGAEAGIQAREFEADQLRKGGLIKGATSLLTGFS